MSTPCKAISTQTATNQENFTKRKEMLQMQRGGNGGNPRNRNLTGNCTLFYYWTHGNSDNLAHTSEICKIKR